MPKKLKKIVPIKNGYNKNNATKKETYDLKGVNICRKASYIVGFKAFRRKS